MSPDKLELSPREKRAVRLNNVNLIRRYENALSVVGRWNWVESRISLPTIVIAVAGSQLPLLSSLVEPALVIGVGTWMASELFKRESILERDALYTVIRMRNLRVRH